MKKIDSKDMEMLVDSDLETCDLTSEFERETALKIISTLNGHMMIRAVSILNYCSKAITRTKVKFNIKDNEN